MGDTSVGELIRAVQAHQLSISEALTRLRADPYVDLGFARVDHQRERRTGIPEVVYCDGKTPHQSREIVRVLYEQSTGPVLATRATEAHAKLIKEVAPEAIWHAVPRVVVARGAQESISPAEILVLTARTSDIPIAEEAVVTIRALGHRATAVCDVGAAGLHRLASIEELMRAADIIVVCAGMDGVLATLVAGLVGGPVVAVPTSIATVQGRADNPLADDAERLRARCRRGKHR